METETDDRQREETIVPVRTGLGAPASGEARAQRRRAGSPWPPVLALTGAAVLAVLAYAVFVWLPERVASTAPQPVPQPVAETPEPTGPSYSEEELAAMQAETERLLSRLLLQQSRVAGLTPEQWAADDWERYRQLGRSGDNAYLANRYWEAEPAYTEALAIGESLQDRAVRLIEDSLAAGGAALQAGDAAVAREHFELVRVIAPDNRTAEAGLARAERLPEVLALVSRGDELRDAGELTAAAEAYREALALDGAWAPAQAALADVNARIEQARFDSIMSRGYAALSAEEYDDARDHFEAALRMRSDSREARDGLSQAEQGMALDQIALAEVRALAFERRELWAQAIAQYEAALATDGTLAFAREGLARARARADLDAKLGHLIDNPDLLLTDRVLADAEALLAEAGEHESPAGLLTAQIERLAGLVELASTPLTVELRSDGLTEVMLYRVGSLGSFAAKEVQLRPGTYTAVGSRIGYRDVRRTFTILPGRELPVITVACEEQI